MFGFEPKAGPNAGPKAGEEKEMEIDATEALRRLDAGEIGAVVDVREAWELTSGTLAGSIHVPAAGLQSAAVDEQHALAAQKDQPVIVYCAHGVRSLTAAQILKSRGFPQAVSLAGGIEAWKKSGYPVDN